MNTLTPYNLISNEKTRTKEKETMTKRDLNYSTITVGIFTKPLHKGREKKDFI